ncbi:hypothetical protein Taro_055586 [Colocasia esculenta]|uniref:Ninja-family protein n=1 Tax=Colocasia esculenta TaxID=4460 RepID=A0A843XTR8_COLES|nr:hypothetical protein [Colocasia esculenta]
MRMAGAGERGEEEKHLAGRIHGYPRDLLRQFSGGVVYSEGTPATAASASGGNGEDSDEIELSLGLSLGGCFGVDPARKRGLQRSSSIAGIPFLKQVEEDPAVSPLLLKRTASLPAEAEEEQRKRKELQCLLRMEAKRKRSERENGPGSWARGPAASPPEQEGDGRKGWSRRPAPEHLGGWWTPNRVTAAASHGGGAAAADGTRPLTPASQASVGSQGSSTSGISDFGSRPPKQEELLRNGAGHLTERNGPAAGKPAKNSAAGGKEEVEAPRKEEHRAGGGVGGQNGPKAAMEEMPCVSTRGGGPNGKLVEGFLYKYGKGEEVRIVCVCHGRFLSPAEFVRHAGGEDVAHPLRHIIVNPSPSCFL